MNELCAIKGYGVKVFLSKDQFRNFIRRHTETISGLENGKEVIAYEKEHPGNDFDPEEDICYNSQMSYPSDIYSLISDTMAKETGIRFGHFISDEWNEETGDAHYIIFTPEYPWNGFTEKEKNLTENELYEIFKRYIWEFSGSVLPGYVSFIAED